MVVINVLQMAGHRLVERIRARPQEEAHNVPEETVASQVNKYSNFFKIEKNLMTLPLLFAYYLFSTPFLRYVFIFSRWATPAMAPLRVRPRPPTSNRKKKSLSPSAPTVSSLTFRPMVPPRSRPLLSRIMSVCGPMAI